METIHLNSGNMCPAPSTAEGLSGPEVISETTRPCAAQPGVACGDPRGRGGGGGGRGQTKLQGNSAQRYGE